MNFLIDNSMSPALAPDLNTAGHNAVHVRDYGMRDEPDERIIDRARDEQRVIITYDLDFPRIMALLNQEKPSLIVFRKMRHPVDQVAALLGNLHRLRISFDEGCIAIFEPDRIRVRSLPLGRR